MEMIVLVDSRGKEIGTAPKLPSHHGATPLHRAFSCYIFDHSGNFLVTRRAQTKKVWPGVWTNSVCGHPGPGETFQNAIVRRSIFELGLIVSNVKVIIPKYIYITPPFAGIIEHEFCPIYVAYAESSVSPNSAEVGGFLWMSWSEYAQALLNDAGSYSFWSKDQFKLLAQNQAFQTFISIFEKE